MTTDKTSMTIEQFSTLMGDQTESTPEIKAFGQLATISSPIQVEEAISRAFGWGWR